MYYVELKKFKFLFLTVILFFIFSFLSFTVKAEDELVLLPDEQTTSSEPEDDSFNSYDARRSHIVKRKPKKEAFLHDNVFIPANGNTSFNGLLGRVSLIIFALLAFLGIAKFLLSRNQFGRPGSLLDELAQKFTGGFSNPQGLKLKQTLILTPGQTIYLIEIDGKRLLIGGTQQGGVQFLTDLTQCASTNEKLNFKQMDELPKSLQEAILVNHLNNDKQNKYTGISSSAAEGTPFMGQDAIAMKNNLPDETKQNIINQNGKFKRRTNFRQSLFNESINNTEELLRTK